MADKRIHVALEGGQIFERYIASKTRDRAELCFYSIDGEAYVGFVTGLDHEWVQITETADDHHAKERLTSTLVQLSNINAVQETGRKVADLEPKEAERVRAYTNLFLKVSQRELSSSS